MATKKKAPRTVAKAAGENTGGRPSKWQPAYVEQARKLALLGLTDAKMADFFGVSESTLNAWKHVHPQFLESLRAGKDDADAKVANSLYHSALGGGTITETRDEVDAEGNTVTKRTVKELPANVTAQIFWLKNRQPLSWRDKVVVEEEPAEALTERARSFETIMAEARERQHHVLVARGILPAGDGAA